MRILLVSTERRWADALRHLFKATDDIVTLPPDAVVQNERLLPAMDLCFVAIAQAGEPAVMVVTQIRGLTAAPIFVLCDRVTAEWEETLLLAGAFQVFTFPLRARLIGLAVDRARPRQLNPSRSPFIAANAQPPLAPIHNGEVLTLLRDLSRLLLHAADGPLFLDAYLRKLREALRCERVILYLVDSGTAERRLKCAFATGIDPQSFTEIRLSRDDGIGRLLTIRPNLLQRQRLSDGQPFHLAAARELDLFGTEFAFPLSARDGLVGVLLVGQRIAGTDYSESELTLVFHLMEELGAVVRNTELHADLLRERRLFSSVLRALPIGCLVLDHELRVVHANAALRAQLAVAEGAAITFEHLPQSWASFAYGVLQGRDSDGEIIVAQNGASGPGHLRLRVRRLADETRGPLQTVLLTVEDVSAELRAQQEAAVSGTQSLLQRVGEQLANEFRNALTPFHTLLQLSRGSKADRNAAFEALSGTMNAAMHRMNRRVDDLAYLAKKAINPELTSLPRVIRGARERLEHILPTNTRLHVRWPESVPDVAISVDTCAVSLAIAELVTNAVEASPEKPIEVLVEDNDGGIKVRVRNRGAWMVPSESAGLRHRAFISDKATGVGLGLEVASRVAEHHGGRFTINPISADIVEAEISIPHVSSS